AAHRAPARPLRPSQEAGIFHRLPMFYASLMARQRERSRCKQRLEALAESNLEPEEARRAAIAALRPAVGFERWCWPLTDPTSALSTSGIGRLDFWPA